MSTMNRIVLCGLVLLMALPATAELPADGEAMHMGVASCATSQCHGSAVPRDGSNVLQNEYVTWTRDDPHSRAFETLSSPASRAMANRLGLASATTAGICLDCHADNVLAERRGPKFQLSDGVGCEACHGGAENWLSSHDNAPAVDHAANLDAGLYPTEDPKARGELCLSCHLGTADKFATHRIMAAGHPRLTFELDTFTELWRTAGRQPHYRIDDDYVERKNGDSHVYAWATGVITEASQRMRLVNSRRFTTGSMFPELGLYDCHACHRSMKTVLWRRLPRHGNAGPGVPFLNDGALVMALALARAVDNELAPTLENALVELHVAGSSDIGRLRRAATNLDSLLLRLDASLSPDVLERSQRRILREILSLGANGNFIDYVSAEQAFMAVQMLVFDIDDPELAAGLDPLGDALNDDERYRPATFARLLADLDPTE